jgi:hypothetical protein
MKTKTTDFDFTDIDYIVVHKINDNLESTQHAEIYDKKIIDRMLKALSKSRKYPYKFFPSFKMDLLKNDMTLYEIYASENYLNINGLMLKSSINIGNIIKKAFEKNNHSSNPSN